MMYWATRSSPAASSRRSGLPLCTLPPEADLREAAVFPAQELAGHLRREQLLLDEHLDDPDAEELLQGRGADPGRDVEHAAVREGSRLKIRDMA